MLSDRNRLHRRAARPRLVALHRALSRLGSVVTVMNTGAHPDDEQNGMLAWLRFGRGMRVVVACSTRGEGGQNTLGPERQGVLGVLRSREMEEAARVIDADVAWLGHGPDDPVHDFGFSKSGPDTLARWGHARTVERLVRAYRHYRPDVVIPTFLDVPGQHGHHRAMTEAAEEALALAADPAAFPEHAAEGLSPWRVPLYYLPAWSGGGDTYDDEVPPPLATCVVRAPGEDPVTGAPWDRLGEMSRAFHASQNMGVWHEAPQQVWPLHLVADAFGGAAVRSPGGGLTQGITGDIAAAAPPAASAAGHAAASGSASGAGGAGPGLAGFAAGLPSSLAELAPLPELARADAALAAAIAAFPDGAAIIAGLVPARRDISAALALLGPATLALHGHRLHRKLVEIDAALFEAAGVDLSAGLDKADPAPGDEVCLTVQVAPGLATDLLATPRFAKGLFVAGPPPQDAPSVAGGGAHAGQMASGAAQQLLAPQTSITLRVSGDAPITNAFLPGWDPMGGNGNLALHIEADIGGERVSILIDTDEPLQLAPPHRVELSPDAVLLRLAAPVQGTTTAPAPVRLTAKAVRQAGGAEGACAVDLAIEPAPGLQLRAVPGGFELIPGADLAAGLSRLAVTADGARAQVVTPVSYPHIGQSRFVRPLSLDVLALDLVLPRGRIGFVDGGADRVGLWLGRMGLDVTPLDSAALEGDLSGFDTILIGLFAFGTRQADLSPALPRLQAWVRAGGNLVTLYHRPSDGWDPKSPPLPLTIGSPSLRWRVTDPAAPVTLLVPDHPLLAGPNRITAADFDGWDKERGLYFASAWDPAYVPLLSMSDAGEAPLTGALVSAKVGAGRHTHTSLVLHHQLDRLVPGAFRLLANLLQAA